MSGGKYIMDKFELQDWMLQTELDEFDTIADELQMLRETFWLWVDAECQKAIKDGRINRKGVADYYCRLRKAIIEIAHDEITAPEE